MANFTFEMGADNDPSDPTKPLFFIWFWVLGGAIADPAPEATAFFNRKSWFVMEGSYRSIDEVSPEQEAEYIAVVQEWLG